MDYEVRYIEMTEEEKEAWCRAMAKVCVDAFTYSIANPIKRDYLDIAFLSRDVERLDSMTRQQPASVRCSNQER